MKILNFGSLNIDYTYRLEHIVAPGETISSKTLEVFPGGKGLNQSIALARAGAEVFHAGAIGTDGDFLIDICKESGVKTQYIQRKEVRTGNAIIQVTDTGQNCIILYPGANRTQSKGWIDHVLKQFSKGDMLLLQNEINMVDYLIDTAYEKGMQIVLNPSPYDNHLAPCNLNKIDIFLMNEVEGEQITGEASCNEILRVMREEFPHAAVVLTLGEKGSVYQKGDMICRQDCICVEPVDTTAAGDTFTGYFLAGLARGEQVEFVMKWSAAASALAVTQKGAVSSIPQKEEVEVFLNK